MAPWLCCPRRRNPSPERRDSGRRATGTHSSWSGEVFGSDTSKGSFSQPENRSGAAPTGRAGATHSPHCAHWTVQFSYAASLRAGATHSPSLASQPLQFSPRSVCWRRSRKTRGACCTRCANWTRRTRSATIRGIRYWSRLAWSASMNDGEKRRRLRLVNAPSTDVGPRRATPGDASVRSSCNVQNSKTVVASG